MKLRNYQIVAAARLREAIQRGGKVRFSVPTGLGRSIILAEACRDTGPAAFFTRSAELARQMEDILQRCEVRNVAVIRTGFAVDHFFNRTDLSPYSVVVLGEDIRDAAVEHRCVLRQTASGFGIITINGSVIVDLAARPAPVQPPRPRVPLFQIRRGRDVTMPGDMRRLRLIIGARPDLAGEGEHIPARLAIELNRHVRLSDMVEKGPNAPGRWSFRVWSDFHRIERLIAAKWVIGHILARTVNAPRPWSKSDYNAAEARMERLAWSADDARLAAPALARVNLIRAATRAAGLRILHEW